METPFAAYTGDQPFVFVCYAHEDSDRVYPEMAWLRDQGLNLWYDEGISAGKNWRTAIGDSLLSASHVLFYVSAASLKSDHCNREINLALDEGKDVVPVYIDDVELTTDLKVGLNRVQALHRDEDASYQQHLLKALGQSSNTIERQPGIASESRLRLTKRVGAGLGFVLFIGAVSWFWPTQSEVPTPALVPNGNSSVTDQADSMRDVDQVALNSVAVLALENLSPDPENAYFAAGVHEEILNQLAKISGLQVISRKAVLRYQSTTQSPSDIAHELSVSFVMEGSVRFAGNRVRITTQLIRAVDDTQLWSETYEFELSDIFAVQSDVATQVSSAMQATLLPEEVVAIERAATENLEAYTLLLQHLYQKDQERARFTLDDDGWLKSGIRKMEKAIELDPKFARGMGELASLNAYKAAWSRFEERGESTNEAVSYANKAIALDPRLGIGYRILAQVFFDRRQWREWRTNIEKAVNLPDLDGRAAFAFALQLDVMGQAEKSIPWDEIAISKDPSSVLFREAYFVHRILQQEYELGLTLAEQFLAVGGDTNAYHVMRAYIFNRTNRKDESLNELSLMSADSMAVSIYEIDAYLYYMRCQSGEREAVMEEIEERNSTHAWQVHASYCLVGAGDFDAVFEIYQQSIARGELINYTYFDEIKADPRWQIVEEYMNWPTL